MSQSKIFKLTLFILATQGCDWKDNPLGFGNHKSSSGNYNTIISIEPTTPFSINITKGEVSGPCLMDQQDIFNNNEICYEIEFERQPVNFDATDLVLSQPGTNATISLSSTLSPVIYTVRIQNYNQDGTDDGIYRISIPAGTISDSYGNLNLEASSLQTSVELSQFVMKPSTTTSSPSGVLANDSCQGLNLETWSQTGIPSLASFFGGSPGISPSGRILSGLVDNLLNEDHLQFRASPDNQVMKWTGLIEIRTGGNYRFRTSSDDGSRFYVNNVLAVNNDGLHGLIAVTSSNISLTAGTHQIELQYFDRTGGDGLFFTYAGPDTSGLFIAPRSEIFQPGGNCKNPLNLDTSMIDPFWLGNAPYTYGLVGIVRDDINSKHIKKSVDEDSFLTINSGPSLDGSVSLATNATKVLAAHNNYGIALGTLMGSTTFGNAWTVIDRKWQLECTTGNDIITIQFPSLALDATVNGIVFSSDQFFSVNVKPLELTELGSMKAVSFRCSDFNSPLQYFTFGRYNL